MSQDSSEFRKKYPGPRLKLAAAKCSYTDTDYFEQCSVVTTYWHNLSIYLSVNNTHIDTTCQYTYQSVKHCCQSVFSKKREKWLTQNWPNLWRQLFLDRLLRPTDRSMLPFTPPIGKIIISWEPALWTLMSGDRVLLLMTMVMMSKKKHCNFRQL